MPISELKKFQEARAAMDARAQELQSKLSGWVTEYTQWRVHSYHEGNYHIRFRPSTASRTLYIDSEKIADLQKAVDFATEQGLERDDLEALYNWLEMKW